MVKRNRRAVRSVVADCQEPEPPLPEQDMDDRRPILDLVSSLHLNSDYSDLVVICGGKTFPAHRLVVCPRSEYFKRACFGGFKETKEPIDLGDKNPILIEKVLEFLYTGDYTIGLHTLGAGDPQFDGDGAQGTTTERAEETAANDTSGEHALNEIASEKEGAANENVTPSPERNEPGIMDESLLHERPALVDGPLEKVPSDQRGSVESIVDPLAGCHPCYFHMRIFGEADYFMISDLKDKAKEQFCGSLRDCYDRKFFAEIIKELYSNRGNYQSLRRLAIDVVIDNLPSLWKGFAPAIDIELMKAVPDFAIDLCVATLDNYVVEPSNMKPYSFPTGFEYKGVDYKF